jgi:hypothetical protein
MLFSGDLKRFCPSVPVELAAPLQGPSKTENFPALGQVFGLAENDSTKGRIRLQPGSAQGTACRELELKDIVRKII